MKVVAPIPVYGRLELLKYTISRLYEKNGVYKVICIGESEEERNLCESLGAEWVRHENKPLGKKWNTGFMAAEKHNPDACLFVGSSDWLSDNWIRHMSEFLGEYDMIGVPGYNMLDVHCASNANHYRFCRWEGYAKMNGKQYKMRDKEPIGIGRVLSRSIMDKIHWRPFDETKDNSMDWFMYNKVLSSGGKVKLVEGDNIHTLSISTSKWPNKHVFNDYWAGKHPAVKMDDWREFVDKHFPEAFKIFSR